MYQRNIIPFYSVPFKGLMRFAVAILLFSCNLVHYSSSKKSNERIEFEKTGCLYKCKAYKIKIDFKGNSEFEGMLNTSLLGKYSRKLSKKENTNIWDLIHFAQPETMKSEYDYGAEDSQQKFLRYYSNDKLKEIRFGNDIPDILKKIDSEIEKIVNGGHWIKAK